ncbi:HPF/RaiA family ribosome-associated protein [Thioalkalivibrio sp. AKL19]|uniref:HPF/RaiA family ribosome-associated protein n=1 Tax=Thioalkalivibrio sp. AKL19 TaxID=1266914 RepID=UPI000429B035|nr:HPF/RaiA family ribosome-associated protein [Thioalkalivibrio sp. AKL19]
MQIQINTDDNIDQSGAQPEHTEATIRNVLERFADQVTRVEVHLSDENSDKKSGNADIRCLLEVRVEGLQPVAVTDEAATVGQAVDGAARKMRRSLDSTLGKRKNH